MTKNETRALAGGVVWLGFLAVGRPDLRGDAWAHALLLFAALVLVPLALDLIAELNDARRTAQWLGWSQMGQLPAAVLLAMACGLQPGIVAAGLAMPWLALTTLLAAAGVSRMLRHGWARPLDRLCGDVALLFSAVGGLWTVGDRAGFAPLGFDAAIVALTAVHFHYAGLLLLLFTGFVVRRMKDSRFVARVAVGVVLGVPAVAVGITTSQLGWGPAVEAAAGSALALSAMLVAIFHVRIALEGDLPAPARVLLGIAGGSLFFGMVLAALYAIRAFAAPLPWLGIPEMRALHGTLNAVGFGLCGVLGWRAAKAAAPPPS